MAAASAGQQLQQQQQQPQPQQQQQHKLNIVGGAQTVQANELQPHQQLNMYKQQQQQQQMLQHQQQQFYQQQQQQAKFVSRVVTNAAMQPQQQILPAGLVNGSANIMQAANVAGQQQQHSSNNNSHSHSQQHIFVCPAISPQLQQQQQQHQQQQQQQTKQRAAQIKLPVKCGTSAAATLATVAASQHCLPATIASRQLTHNNQQQQQQQQQQQHHQQIYAKNVAKTSNDNSNISTANVAPGWRRLTNNNEVAYVSPTGKTLRTQFQIKDYLLSQGTCKCGLPCPLRPEYFFDFNAQVPNMPLKALSGNSQEFCSHQRHLLEAEQLHKPQAFKDSTSRDATFGTLMTTAAITSTTSTTTTTSTVPTTPTTIELANQDANCLKYPSSANKLATSYSSSAGTGAGEAVQAMSLSTPAAGMQTSQTLSVDKRSTAAPTATPTAAAASVDHVIKLTPQASSPATATGAQQQPNFKDDPAGYLQQQTTLLHNTLNVNLDAKPVVRTLPLETSSQQQQQQQQQQRQRIRRLSLFAGGKWELESTPASSTVVASRSLHVDTAAAFARPLNPQITSITVVPAPQESPVSSSAAVELEKRPEQVGAISTSHESPRHSLSSPTDSLDSTKSTPSASPKPQTQTQLQLQAQPTAQLRVLRQQCQPLRQTMAYNGNGGTTLTRSIVTTTAGISRPGTTLSSASSTVAQLQSMANNSGGNQLIMTSSGQLLVIPSASKQPATSGQHQHQQQQSPHRSTHPSGGYIVSQPSALLNTSGAKVLHQQIIASSQASQISQASPQTVLLNTLPNGGYIVQHQQQPQPQQQMTELLAMPQQQQQLQVCSPEAKRRPRKRKSSVSSTPPPPSSLGVAKSSPSSAKTHSPQISPSIPSQAPALLQQAANAAAAAAAAAVAAAAPPPPAPPQFSQQFQLSPGIQGIVVNKPTPTAGPQTQQLLLQNGQILQQVNLIGHQQLLMPAGLVMGPDATLLQIQNMPTTSLLSTPQGPVMLRTPSPQNKASFISPSAGGQQYIVGANGQLSPIGQIYSTPMGLMMPTAQQSGASFVQASPTATIQIQQQPQQQPQQMSLHPSYVADSRQTTAASPPDTTTCSPSSPERPPSHRSSGSGDMVQCVSSSEPDAAISPQSVESRLSPSSTDCERSEFPSQSHLNNLFSQPSHMFKPTEPKIRRIHISSQATSSEGNQLAVLGQGMRIASSISSSSSSASSLSLSTTPSAAGGRPVMTPSNNHHHHHPPNIYVHNQKVVSVDYQEPPETTQQLPALLDTPAASSEAISLKSKSNSRGTSKRGRRPHRVNVTRGSPSSMALTMLPPRTFAIGELIWGPARGHPAWPGKIVKMPDGVCTPSQQFDHVWVQWFGGGGRSTSELIPVNSLQSLSEGLDAHHKAQKDTRKSRKLNSQLERAIQEAMTELDNISATTASTIGSHQLQQQQQQPTSTNNNSNSINSNGLARGKRATPATGQAINNCGSMTLTASTAVTLTGLFSPQHQQRAKPIRIAPAPPTGVSTAASLAAANASAAEILKLAK
ncbi:hypothetical protein KR044_006789 [Drosophila immigrans]|nr:hypothetical protein KR044_006789 [Drosophila immigrans]